MACTLTHATSKTIWYLYMGCNVQGEHKLFPRLQTYISQENYCTWNTNIPFFSKRNSVSFLKHISTLQHVLLLLHGECLNGNHFLYVFSNMSSGIVAKASVIFIFKLYNSITISTWHKIVETNLSNVKKYVCIPRSFLVIHVCNQRRTLCSPCRSTSKWCTLGNVPTSMWYTSLA
jgi:hypothetical protein